MLVQLVPKLKTNKSLELPLVDVKENSSILMRLEMARIAQNKQKRPYFHSGPSSWSRKSN